MIGKQVAHFYVLRNIGSGGMGEVWEAQDTRLPRSVALKVLRPALAKNVDAVRRFKREARLASSLNHPNICTILDVDERDGHSFIVMELLQGTSLKQRLTAGPMSLDDIVKIGVQVADALAAAHEQGIMHRDITPGNIFITRPADLVKLLDFGLAKQFADFGEEGDVTDDLTRPGTVAGTIHYMAPERFREGAKVDHRCDLFSLGAVLYQMATGSRPFEVTSRDEVVALILAQPHIPLRRLAPHLPVSLERIVDRLLAKDPEARADARTLRDELRALRRKGASPPGAARAAGAGRDRVSVAVLPFRLVGTGDGAIGDFRDGLAEAVSGRLSGVEGVRVAPRTSTRHVEGRPIREIGTALRVQLVVEGSIQRDGDRVRVRAYLVDAEHERHVRPVVEVDRCSGHVLDVQDDVAREIVDQLTPSLGAAVGRGQTRNPQALNAFKRGQHYWAGRFTGGWEPAIKHFQAAVDHDDGFAAAHVGLAAAYEFLGFYCLMKPRLAFEQALRSAQRALDIDDQLAAAHTELAMIRFGGEWDWDGSEQAFRRALELDPNSFVAHIAYAWLLMLLGREEAALAEARRGHELAPASRFAAAGCAQTLYLAKRYDETIELANSCLAGDSDYVFATSLRGQCYELKEMFPEAIADLQHTVALTSDEPFYVGMLGHCYGKAGLHDKARALIGQLDRQRRERYVPPQCYVYIYAGLGEPAKAMQYQEQAYADGASPFNYLVPSIRDLYALDPEHRERLEQKMRLIL